jgi:hypothetical protein
MEDYQNIFQKSCLGQLSISCWNGSKVIESAVMDTIGDPNWISGKKMLINPEKLNGIKAICARARLYLQHVALPFPIKGLILTPKDSIAAIDTALTEFKMEFHEEVNTFLNTYEFARADAKRNLGTLFNESDYPLNINDKFRFEWRFLTLNVPGRNSILSPEMYEKEKNKFLEMMEESRNIAIGALREEFRGLIDHMTERLSGGDNGRNKQFKSSMLEKLNEFFESFNNRNIFDDSDLAELVQSAKSIISGVSPDQLRNNNFLREHINNSMSNLKTIMDENLEDLPRRRIRIAA